MVSRVPDVMHTSPKDWRYVSEGGATIVFSYIGLKDSPLDGMVLRLRKAIYPDETQIRPLELAEHPSIFQRFRNYVRGKIPRRSSQDGDILVDEPDDPMIEYQHQCMQRLIPPEHLPRMESVRVNRRWLKNLEKAHNEYRPADRRQKDGIDMDRTKAVLATDLIGGQGLAVEIKPKWAFLPRPDFLSDETRAVKTQTCRFCMHSSLKLKEGDTSIAHRYCPLDLFSGDEERMTKALLNLWDSWIETQGAANNLKIFVNGTMIKPQENMSTLETKLEQSDGAVREYFAQLVVSCLNSVSVLSTLSRLQRTLDALDIEGLAALWKKAEAQGQDPIAGGPESEDEGGQVVEYVPSPIGVSSPRLPAPEPKIGDWSDFIGQYLSSPPDPTTPDTANLRYFLLAYLLSATFKDCSIILRPGEKATVTVIDLDPKSLSRLKKWEKLDKEIATAYLDVSPEQRKKCVDAGSGTK